MSPIIRITIESAELVAKMSKEKPGKPPAPYYNQVGWLWTVDANGNQEKHPSRIEFYAPRGADQKTQVAYPVGEYFLSPKCVQVRFGRPEIGFLELEPLKPAVSKAVNG